MNVLEKSREKNVAIWEFVGSNFWWFWGIGVLVMIKKLLWALWRRSADWQIYQKLK